jgi:hypothetical protein
LFDDAVSTLLEEMFSQSVAGVKSGGEGKTDTDGVIDIDDLTCETARAHLSSELEYELGEFEKPGTDGWHGGRGSMASFMRRAGGAPSSSAGTCKVSSGDDRSRTSRGEPWETTPASS